MKKKKKNNQTIDDDNNRSFFNDFKWPSSRTQAHESCVDVVLAQQQGEKKKLKPVATASKHKNQTYNEEWNERSLV